MNLNLATIMTLVTFAIVAIVGTAIALAVRIALESLHGSETSEPAWRPVEQSKAMREARAIVYACWREEVR